MKRSFLTGSGMALGTALASILVPSTAFAQASTTRDGAAAEGDTIVVTGLKRRETLQEVSATINVVNGESLAAHGVYDLTQLPTVSPGVTVERGGDGNPITTIRGVGTSFGVPSFDNSVGFFVDGVYAAHSREFLSSLFDLERVEVIKGTQSALLGKNTSMGAISLVTRKPGSQFAANLSASHDFELGSDIISAGIDIPLTSSLGVRVAGQYLDREGWVFNRVTQHNGPSEKTGAIRAVASWQPATDLNVTLLYQYEDNRQKGSAAEFAAVGNGVPALLTTLAGYSFEGSLNDITALSYQGRDDTHGTTSHRATGTVEWILGGFTITSITGWTSYDDSRSQNISFLPADYLTRNADEKNSQFSQEIRLASPASESFDYVIGALYLKNNYKYSDRVAANYPSPPFPIVIGGTALSLYKQDSRSLSAFGQARVAIVDRLKLLVGARYTNEDKSAIWSRVALAPGFYPTTFQLFGPTPLSRSESNVDGSIGVEFRVNENVLLYASWGRGTKSGGFAPTTTLLASAPYKSEVARSTEAGFKFQTADRAFTLNMAGFYTEVDDFQLVTFIGSNFFIGNTDLRTQGVELETVWRPAAGLVFRGQATYADVLDRQTGMAPPRAPKWTGRVSGSYEHQLWGDYVWNLDAGLSYRSRMNHQRLAADALPATKVAKIDLGLGVANERQGWTLRLLAKNLNNARSTTFGIRAPIIGTGVGNFIAYSDEPRTVALQLNLNL